MWGSFGMNMSVFTQKLQQRNVLAGLIGVTTAFVFGVNAFGLIVGITDVLPHLFYIPIVLTAYYFPRRGVLFATVVSAIYCSMTYIAVPTHPGILISAGVRGAIFILIAAGASLLTNHLRESEEKYRMLADYTYDWEYWIGPDEKIQYTTPSCERITGYTAGEFYTSKRLINTILHPDDVDALDHHLARFSGPMKPESLDFRIIHRDGSIRWIGHVCQPIYNARGEFLGRRASNRDITERKHAEEANQETSRRLAEIISFLPDPTLVVDNTGVVVAWNHAMEELSKVPARDAIGTSSQTCTRWISGQDGPILVDYVLRRDTGGIRAAYPGVHFDGETVKTEKTITRTDGTKFSLWISATPLIDHNGKVTGAIESVRDVTDQKNVQRALKESKAYLDTVINTLADPLFIKDQDNRFAKVNDSFCQFTGHSREELLGKTDHDFFKPEEADVFRQKDEEVFRTGRGNENEENITDSKGITHIIVTKKTLFTNVSGEKFIVGIIRDITERKKTETALQLALKKLGMLSSITRHDILNQVMGLRTFLDLSREDLKGTPAMAFIEKEEQAAQAIQRQIEFTRYYEELGVQAPRWNDVAETFLSAASQLPLGRIHVDTRVTGLEVYADPLIGKVFYNLMENSLRHGDHVTEITLDAEETPGGIVVTYRDNGAGISAEDKSRLFRKGFGKNTGLGLFLSREILSITGISITEDGEPGSGVRFRITVQKGGYRFTRETP